MAYFGIKELKIQSRKAAGELMTELAISVIIFFVFFIFAMMLNFRGVTVHADVYTAQLELQCRSDLLSLMEMENNGESNSFLLQKCVISGNSKSEACDEAKQHLHILGFNDMFSDSEYGLFSTGKPWALEIKHDSDTFMVYEPYMSRSKFQASCVSYLPINASKGDLFAEVILYE